MQCYRSCVHFRDLIIALQSIISGVTIRNSPLTQGNVMIVTIKQAFRMIDGQLVRRYIIIFTSPLKYQTFGAIS